MKTRLLSVQTIVLASAVFSGISFYGQELDVPKQVQEKNKEASALLEKLKGYMQDDDIRAPRDMQKVIDDLVEIGSTNVVQFFLDNITWKPTKVNGFYSVETNVRGSVIVTVRQSPMGSALVKIKDVPLCQCLDTLMRSEDGTIEALMLECVAKWIHGKMFLCEIEKLAETSPDTERWMNMRKRLENNEPIRLPKMEMKQAEQLKEQGGN